MKTSRLPSPVRWALWIKLGPLGQLCSCEEGSVLCPPARLTVALAGQQRRGVSQQPSERRLEDNPPVHQEPSAPESNPGGLSSLWYSAYPGTLVSV